MLSPELQVEILSLYFSQKKKVRAIARALGLNRKSVYRVVTRKSVVTQVTGATRTSLLDPYKTQIGQLLKDDSETTTMVILQRIRDQGYLGGYTTLRNWMKSHSPVHGKKEAFFKMDFAVGEAAQVDWGEFMDVFGDGVKIHCFVMVLCYSRLLYIEFTRSERFEEFIRCHENAIRYFEGKVTAEFWYDNLPTAVTERMGKLIRFNSRFLAYVGHHHVSPHACNVARGNEKGRVEDGVKYIRLNFWHNRKFTDFDDLCRQASEWRDQTANHREHRATRKIPKLVFEHEEKSQLRDANLVPYETDEVLSIEVRPDFHFIFETNQYSVPWTLVGVVVTIRITAKEIKIFYKDQFVTKHSRSYLKHQLPFTKSEHSKGLMEIKPQGKNTSTHWQTTALESYGPSLKQYLQCLRHSPRSLKKEISTLLALGTVYGEQVLADAVDALLKRGVIGTEQIELYLKAHDKSDQSTKRPAPMNIQNERLTRVPARIDLRQYDKLCLRSQESDCESGAPSRIPHDSQKIDENGNNCTDDRSPSIATRGREEDRNKT